MSLVQYDRATLTEVLRTKSCRPGVVAFWAEMQERLLGNPGWNRELDGCYNPRPIRGSSTLWSTHAVGRGLDLGVTLDNKGLSVGNFLFLTLLDPSNSVPLSIQQIIWNRMICRPGESPRNYTGTSPHRDHLHIEFNRWGAEHNTREWVGGVLDR